eukprot:6475415-Prymnesium_polylepis.1
MQNFRGGRGKPPPRIDKDAYIQPSPPLIDDMYGEQIPQARGVPLLLARPSWHHAIAPIEYRPGRTSRHSRVRAVWCCSTHPLSATRRCARARLSSAAGRRGAAGAHRVGRLP